MKKLHMITTMFPSDTALMGFDVVRRPFSNLAKAKKMFKRLIDWYEKRQGFEETSTVILLETWTMCSHLTQGEILMKTMQNEDGAVAHKLLRKIHIHREIWKEKTRPVVDFSDYCSEDGFAQSQPNEHMIKRQLWDLTHTYEFKKKAQLSYAVGL